ncbi:MAG: hypothetical protein LN409_05005, partial [Candidatus Thermoplasmatota archaeon]|nr:hypothetical protein [Candidatus Thermoplasmatota archaeon]
MRTDLSDDVVPGRLFGKFAADGRTFVGTVCDGGVVELDTDRMSDLFDGSPGRTARSHNADAVKVLAPVDRPSKIICIGLNYRSHISEMGWEAPSSPILFTKPPSA